jgi:hypothetical protein
MRKSRVDQRFRKRLYKRGLRPILITRLLIQGMGGLPTPSLFQRHRPKYRDLAGRRIVRSDLHPEFSRDGRHVPLNEDLCLRPKPHACSPFRRTLCTLRAGTTSPVGRLIVYTV